MALAAGNEAVSRDPSALLNLSLQELSDMDVTSVSKTAEKASQAPAAIYVITQEDIRRSGMQSIPELLRMVPGLQVAQSGSQNWAVSSRGFDSQYSNKMLVLIDGRTVYTPVFSGVNWDSQQVMLEDIERIEVIRGPGATLWGANAVNGVINIISKNAHDTQGTLLTTAAGTKTRLLSQARYGGQKDNLAYRVYGQYLDNDEERFTNEAHGGDAWQQRRSGFRFDWDGDGKDSAKQGLTVQGDLYEGREDVTRALPVTRQVSSSLVNFVADNDQISGANLLGRWNYNFDKTSGIILQAYYDDVLRQSDYVDAAEHTQTFDVDFQHNLMLGDRNAVTWGAGFRETRFNFGNSFYISFSPEDKSTALYSGFLQDKITLLPDTLFFTLGSKLEHNDFSGLEIEPSARLAWTPTKNQTVWAAVSRAVRSPTRSDQDLLLTLGSRPTRGAAFTSVLQERGNPDASSEDVVAYELGYRIEPRKDVALDITGFINEYTNLASVSPGQPTLAFDPTFGRYVEVPLIRQDYNSGRTQGIETALTWEATRQIKFSGSYTLYYSYLDIQGASLVTTQGNSPHQQFNLRSFVDLPHDFQFDTSLYCVGPLPSVNVPGYARLDMRLGWVATPGLDLSLIGQNLLQAEHTEFSPFIYQVPEEISRSVLAKATLRF